MRERERERQGCTMLPDVIFMAASGGLFAFHFNSKRLNFFFGAPLRPFLREKPQRGRRRVEESVREREREQCEKCL